MRPPAMRLKGRSLTSLASRATYICLALALITYYWALLRIRPRRLLRHAERSPGAAAVQEVAPASSRLSTITSAVERAAELHPLRPHCLERALASRTLLHVRGEQARVIVGVSQVGCGLTAHAWVEIDARTNDASHDGFVRLTRLS